MLYTKGETLFGIDRAFRLRDAENFIIVEGAPDALRLQSIGLENTVASLGTSWNENQRTLLKRYKSSLCFIPDSDVAPEGQYGPGFKAVMECGTLAIRKGFHATVKELPFGTRELTEEELAEIKEKQRLRERNAMYQRRRRAKFMPKTKAIRAKVQEAEIKEALENASAKAEKLLMADNDTHIAEVVAGENKVYVDTGIFPTAEEVKEKYAI